MEELIHSDYKFTKVEIGNSHDLVVYKMLKMHWLMYQREIMSYGRRKIN